MGCWPAGQVGGRRVAVVGCVRGGGGVEIVLQTSSGEEIASLDSPEASSAMGKRDAGGTYRRLSQVGHRSLQTTCDATVTYRSELTCRALLTCTHLFLHSQGLARLGHPLLIIYHALLYMKRTCEGARQVCRRLCTHLSGGGHQHPPLDTLQVARNIASPLCFLSRTAAYHDLPPRPDSYTAKHPLQRNASTPETNKTRGHDRDSLPHPSSLTAQPQASRCLLPSPTTTPHSNYTLPSSNINNRVRSGGQVGGTRRDDGVYLAATTTTTTTLHSGPGTDTDTLGRGVHRHALEEEVKEEEEEEEEGEGKLGMKEEGYVVERENGEGVRDLIYAVRERDEESGVSFVLLPIFDAAALAGRVGGVLGACSWWGAGEGRGQLGGDAVIDKNRKRHWASRLIPTPVTAPTCCSSPLPHHTPVTPPALSCPSTSIPSIHICPRISGSNLNTCTFSGVIGTSGNL
ncbi:hypothetical protein O3P69_001355 [Scylla paramamosain]|uniref:Uncharacterized protein n=1 Tax=Scylla paramamosain TaxID=85552 RepID=A0AAW0UR21_SCYPA